MSITNTPQQLLLIKQLYDDASILADREDELSLTKALLLLDLSVDQMLNQVIRDCSLNTNSDAAFGKKDQGWQKIWDAADRAIKEKGFNLIYHRDLSNLHEVRNMAQHNATIPTKLEIQRYIEPSREMISAIFKDIYKIDFHSFTLWDLIENKDLRQLLQDSEYALNRNQSEVCIAGCNLAYRHIITAIRSHTKFRNFQPSFLNKPKHGTFTPLPPGIASQIQKATEQLNDAIRQGVAEFRKEIMGEIEFLENEVVSIGIGLPIMDTRRFQKIGNTVLISEAYSGDIKLLINRRNTAQNEKDQEARFMLNYLSKLIHLIDESYSEVLETIKLEKQLREQSFWKEVENDTTSI